MTDQDPPAAFTEIGKGTFGIIFTDATHPAPPRILKRTLQPHIDPRNWLAQDAKWHEWIHNTFSSLRQTQNIALPNVPAFHGVMDPATSSFWWTTAAKSLAWADASRSHIDAEYACTPSPLLCAQRIPIVSEHITRSLLETFHHDVPSSSRELALASPQNNNALLRLYFGKSFDSSAGRTRMLKTVPSLRNFPMGRARLEACLSWEGYEGAIRMLADAMAVLHWVVRCDGRDVEFVFGGVDPTPQAERKAKREGEESEGEEAGEEGDNRRRMFEISKGGAEMWLLDFNQVTEISMDEEGVQKAVLGLVENDPYFPKPGSGKQGMRDWKAFREEYLCVSRTLLRQVVDTGELKEDVLRLPEMFVEDVERRNGLNEYQHLFGS